MKKSNWTQALAETIEAAKKRPFSWGKFDCCIFISECVIAQTGVDPMPEFRGHYTTKTGANRVVKKYGGLEAVINSKFKRITKNELSRGDLVMFKSPEGLTMGAVFNQIWAPTESGVNAVNCEILACWRVE